MPAALHLNLDDAWEEGIAGLPWLDGRAWGPRLRFAAPARLIEEFYREAEPELTPFLLYGSGDFHHLSALWLRRLRAPFRLVSFDNHPDWDVRPPRWACGGWINRALELPQLQKASIWGCGNFECWWPGQFFGNRRAEREGRLDLHIWVDHRPVAQQQRRGAMTQANWRAQFQAFVQEIAGETLYVTIDLDCLVAGAAVTNWENGRFSVDDLLWALAELRSAGQIIGGDVCGAWSVPRYARAGQRFIAQFDHPKLEQPPAEEIRRINRAALERIWPALLG